MKQSDIAALILVVAVTMVVSYFVGNALINTEENRTAEVEVVDPIPATFPSPDEEPLSQEADIIYNDIFTEDAINPTELIQIGEGQNEAPFSDESN